MTDESTEEEVEPIRWLILGIHGPDVRTVEDDVARVRFFHDKFEDGFNDIDWPLPELPPGVSPTTELYVAILTPQLDDEWEKIT